MSEHAISRVITPAAGRPANTQLADRPYIAETQLTSAEIEMRVEAGELELWRVDASGTVWFKTIRGVPEDHTSKALKLKSGIIYGTPTGTVRFEQ